MAEDKTAPTKPRVWIIAAAAALAVAVGGFWYYRTSQIEAGYIEALAACARSKAEGSARIDAMESLYGKDSAPKNIRFEVAMCSLENSTEELQRLNRILGN